MSLHLGFNYVECPGPFVKLRCSDMQSQPPLQEGPGGEETGVMSLALMTEQKTTAHLRFGLEERALTR